MALWIPTSVQFTQPKPFPSIASESKIDASLKTNEIQGINDQLIPKNSADKTHALYHWWPAKNETHWIVYNFKNPETVSECEIYWFKDTPNGGCDLPEKWKLYYKLGNEWKEVNPETPYPLIEDKMNKIVFNPVTTSALKLEVQLSENYSAGIHEWIVN